MILIFIIKTQRKKAERPYKKAKNSNKNKTYEILLNRTKEYYNIKS